MRTERIIPAVIPERFDDVKNRAVLVRGLVSFVQIDVLDGDFTPSASWPYILKDEVDEVFEEIVEGSRTFPFPFELAYEADLMIEEPERNIAEWVEAGARRIIVHLKSTKVIADIIDHEAFAGIPGFRRIELGVAIDIETPNEYLYPWMEKVDFIQCMGIARVGFSGEQFDERVLEKILDFKEKFPRVIIQVDGGVNLESAPRLIAAGADRLVANSAIFGNNDIPAAIEALEQAAYSGPLGVDEEV
ncbi:hypothetical protein L0Y49_01430 [bacterium]|nr:hypothetical protein [bacterium]